MSHAEIASKRPGQSAMGSIGYTPQYGQTQTPPLTARKASFVTILPAFALDAWEVGPSRRGSNSGSILGARRANSADLDPCSSRPCAPSDPGSGPLGAGRSQVQHLSPRLEDPCKLAGLGIWLDSQFWGWVPIWGPKCVQCWKLALGTGGCRFKFGGLVSNDVSLRLLMLCWDYACFGLRRSC
jgi:hypothetical protein